MEWKCSSDQRSGGQKQEKREEDSDERDTEAENDTNQENRCTSL